MLTHSHSFSFSLSHCYFYTFSSFKPPTLLFFLFIPTWWPYFIFLRKNRNTCKQMSIFFHHKVSQPKCISVLILYLPCCMKWPSFAKAIISSFVLDLIPFYQLLTSLLQSPTLSPTTRTLWTALKRALIDPSFKNKAKQITPFTLYAPLYDCSVSPSISWEVSSKE